MLGGTDVDDASAVFLALYEGCELAAPDVGVLNEPCDAALGCEDAPGQFVEVFANGSGRRSHSPRRVSHVADDELQVGCQ